MINPDFHSRRETRPEEGPSRNSLRADCGVHVGIAGRLHTYLRVSWAMAVDRWS